jgi:hypothetical protein
MIVQVRICDSPPLWVYKLSSGACKNDSCIILSGIVFVSFLKGLDGIFNRTVEVHRAKSLSILILRLFD